MLFILLRSSIYWSWKVFVYVRPGVTGGKAAGMEVVAVPSIPKQTHLYIAADEVINSLLDLQPELWGLPPFDDCKSLKTWINVAVLFNKFLFILVLLGIWFVIAGIDCTLPLEIWHIGGPVVKGFGRGSKVLGIPTGMEISVFSLCVTSEFVVIETHFSLVRIYFITYLTLMSHFVSMKSCIKLCSLCLFCLMTPISYQHLTSLFIYFS